MLQHDSNSAWCICVPQKNETQEFVGVSQAETEEHPSEVVLENSILKKAQPGGKLVSEFVREPTEASGLAFEEIPFKLGDRVAVWSAGRQVWYEDGTVKDVGPCGVQVLYNSGSYKKTVPHSSTEELLRKPGGASVGAQFLPSNASDKEMCPPACGESELGDWRRDVCESFAGLPRWNDVSRKPGHGSACHALRVKTCALLADVADDSARSTSTAVAHEFRLSFTFTGPKGSAHAGASTFTGVSRLEVSEAAVAGSSPAAVAGQGFLFATPFKCDGKSSLLLGGILGPADKPKPLRSVLEVHLRDATTREVLQSFLRSDEGGKAAGCGCTIA